MAFIFPILASIGCPNLLKTVFTAEQTEELLELAEEQFLTHPRAVRASGQELVLTSLFDWYGADFADNRSELFDYLSDFVSEDIIDLLVDEPTVKYEYDWNLNSK